MDRACCAHGDIEEQVWNFGGKARRKVATCKRRRRREDNIKMDLREV
jgi:hypothetical protein